MKLSTTAHYAQGYAQVADEVQALESAGLDVVWLAESYSVDAVSALGFLAGKTERITIASGILNIYSRTPALLAMTAAGLDALSGGRFLLGLGASGPQVVEGFHAVPFDAPVSRLREVVEICRKVWKREEKLVHAGERYRIPLEGGTGLGKPLKIINHPVRDEIPIALATLGKRSVALTAEIADVWLPAFFMPERAHAVWGDALAEGAARRASGRAPLEVYAGGPVAIGDGLEGLRDDARARPALYVGGMGARDQNFYNRIFRQYGYEAEAARIQSLYLDGRKDEAAAAVPADFLAATSLIGPEGWVRDRIAAWREAGVTALHVTFTGRTREARVRQCEKLRELLETS